MAAVRPGGGGRAIRSARDLDEWTAAQASGDETAGERSAVRRPAGERAALPAAGPYTYVVAPDGVLRLAPRRGEHVACAAGGRVLAAGEITFVRQAAGGWSAAEVSNHSTGYCPDVTSWDAVATALDRAGIGRPDGFTYAALFRRCPACREHALVKDGDFVCACCGTELPAEWNIDGLPPGPTAALLLGDPELALWVRELDEADDLHEVAVRLPAGSELTDLLLDFAMAHEDIGPVLAAGSRLAADDALAWLLERCVRLFVRDMGIVGGGPDGGPRPGPRLPTLPPETGPAGHWFAVLVLAATAPHTLAYHRGHGVPPEVSRRTFGDVGRQCAVCRRRHGTAGVANTFWLIRHFRGMLFQLGRLQFERTRLGGTMGRAVAAAGMAAGPGDLDLAVHIPDFSGPLTPDACDDSVARARAFFPRHFPDEPYAVATCHSWLLDPQLADHLPATSNIVAFQRRFRPGYPVGTVDDQAPVSFVFGDPALPPAGLPRHTAVQRAVGDHLRAGRHWYGGNGWFALRDPADQP